ncbi:hypothetical protein ACVR0S_07770 [Streptococcus dentapri]|uniref:Uncharacterized protein n=1 Tax=Streptococcus dentapri TaxID=573564 RepID=A0ABV8CZK3_9STRE
MARSLPADGNLGAASRSAVGDPTAAKSLADSFDATVEYMNKVNEINMAEKASGSDPASGRNGHLDKGTWYLDDALDYRSDDGKVRDDFIDDLGDKYQVSPTQ